MITSWPVVKLFTARAGYINKRLASKGLSALFRVAQAGFVPRGKQTNKQIMYVISMI